MGLRITHAGVWGKGAHDRGLRLDKKSPAVCILPLESPQTQKVAGRLLVVDRYVCWCIDLRSSDLARWLVAVCYSAAAAFFWLFTFAQRFRCASAIAFRALALSLRRGLGSEDAEEDVFFDVLRVVAGTPPRMARAWRKRAISSSMAFNMWSFKGDSFQHGGGRLQAKNNRSRRPVHLGTFGEQREAESVVASVCLRLAHDGFASRPRGNKKLI